VKAASLGVVAVVGLVLFGAAPSAQARLSCSFSGLPRNLLSVTATGGSFAEVSRSGQDIVVRGSGRPVACSGGVATVLNTDTIKVSRRGRFESAYLLLAGGPFAPGATPEAGGASEIEIEFSGPNGVLIFGTRQADAFEWGPGPGAAHAPGLNLNPGDTDDEDVDVTLTTGLAFAFLSAKGGQGNDTIIPSPGGPFPNGGVSSSGGPGDDRLMAPKNSGGTEVGQTGDDVLIGGRRGDLLIGGSGNDRFRGGGGPDRISGGRGRDLILGGSGRDSLTSRDSWRDRVRCGPGRDQVKADRRDQLRGCELVRRSEPLARLNKAAGVTHLHRRGRRRSGTGHV
jgi:Ca2+-binding RTX toxin-like protein